MKTYKIYIDLLKENHLLIAGTTGCGKSTLLNSLIFTDLLLNGYNTKHIYIDIKRVELSQYKHLKSCYSYVDTVEKTTNAFNKILNEIEKRYKHMQKKKIKYYDGIPIYIFIDELADLLTIAKKEITPLLQRILQMGRAAAVHVVACTQSIHTAILPSYLRINFDSRVCLKVISKKDSQLILEQKGAESLPRYGYAYIMRSCFIELYQVPEIPQKEINKLINR